MAEEFVIRLTDELEAGIKGTKIGSPDIVESKIGGTPESVESDTKMGMGIGTGISDLVSNIGELISTMKEVLSSMFMFLKKERKPEENIIKITNELEAGVKGIKPERISPDTGTKDDKPDKGLVGVGAKLGVGLGIIGELLSMAKEVLSGILRPIKVLVVNILKLVAELLRPLVDVMLYILKPILMIVKPLIDMFKTFMAPFMAIAKEFGMMAKQQMAGGDTTGAIATSLEAVKTILGPFVVSLVSVTLQLATTLIIGGVTTIMSNIMDVMGTVMQHVPVIGTAIKESLDTARVSLEAGSSGMIDKINESLVFATESVLGVMLTEAENRLAEFKGRYSTDYNLAMLETPAGALAEMTKETENYADTMETELTDGLKEMDVQVTKQFDSTTGNAVTTMGTGLDSMVSSVRIFTAKLEAFAEDINAISFSSKSGNKEQKKGIKVGVSLGIGFGFSVEII